MNETNKDNVNSHIQMPKGILKQFTDSKNQLYYIDMSDEYRIKKGHPKSLNTQNGYYANDTETYLNRTIETHLNSVIEYVSNIDADCCTFPDYFRNISFRYLYSLLARSAYFMENAWSVSRDHIVRFLIEKSKESQFLKDVFQVSCILNKTSNPFILPNGGITECGKDLICPLSTHTALYFYNSDNCIFKTISDDDVVRIINLNSISSEHKHDHRYVISNDREYLSELCYEWKNAHNE